MVDLDLLHQKVLYTQCRVKTTKAGGSATIIYSKPGSTFVLSCHHVVSDAISVKKEWEASLGKEIMKEYRQLITVEFFDYENVKSGSRPVNYSVDGDLVAYDQTHDMALIKLRTRKEYPHVAKFYPKMEETKIKIGMKTYAIGVALLHDPILTEGMITHMGDEIDYKDYWMSSSAIIYGNSGGAMFLADTFEFIGIPSRIDVIGWGNAITHLGYFSPIHRVYKFLDEQLFQFIYDSNYTEEGCEKERIKRKKLEEQRLRLTLPGESETESKSLTPVG